MDKPEIKEMNRAIKKWKGDEEKMTSFLTEVQTALDFGRKKDAAIICEALLKRDLHNEYLRAIVITYYAYTTLNRLVQIARLNDAMAVMQQAQAANPDHFHDQIWYGTMTEVQGRYGRTHGAEAGEEVNTGGMTLYAEANAIAGEPSKESDAAQTKTDVVAKKKHKEQSVEVAGFDDDFPLTARPVEKSQSRVRKVWESFKKMLKGKEKTPSVISLKQALAEPPVSLEFQQEAGPSGNAGGPSEQGSPEEGKCSDDASQQKL